MSDKLDDIDKLYRRDVLSDDVPRTFALFSIPEYPELESGEGMWAVCLDALFTALRYIAPATILTLFWGQQSFLFKILKHIDLAFRAIIFSSDEQKQSVLKWLAEAGPVRVDQLDTVWRHGWILCGVLDKALPGACAGHPPTSQTLKHAQTIADHYLGVDPGFSRQELESNDCLSRHQEWKLAHYLDRIRSALAKVPPPVSKPVSQRTSPEAIQFTMDYIARGSGLAAAQINHKMFFKVYPTAQQSLEPGDITVLIRGPKDTYGMVVIPPILGKSQMIRQKLLNLQATRQYTVNALPITQGATYLRTYGRTDMNKTYHIPKTKYDIEMNVECHEEFAKVGYLVNLEGKYEISIVSRGQSIAGSPFTVTASYNIIRTLERESFCLEDGEEIDIVDVKTERKVVLRIVDFVTEKMLLNENGTLEKISNDDANTLMATNKIERKAKKSDLSSPEYNNVDRETTVQVPVKRGRFRQVATQVKSLINACKAFYEGIQIKESKEIKRKSEESQVRPHSRQGIPDVVNSTFNDSMMNPYAKKEKFEMVLKPNYLTATTPEYDTIYEENIAATVTNNESYKFDNARSRFNKSDLEPINKKITEVKNPFLNVFDEDSLSDEVKYEDEIEDPAHIAEIEGLGDLPIKIVIQEDEDESISPTTNPFIQPELLERPKTPVLKIITGEIKDRVDGVYVDPHIEQITEDILGNEFINPFFVHQHQTASNDEKPEPLTTFIIGAPVSLPPIVTASLSDPDMSSILITSKDKSLYSNEFTENRHTQIFKNKELSSSVFSTPLHAKLGQNSITSSTFHSLDSNLLESTEDLLIRSSENNNGIEISMLNSNQSVERSKKDTWDSAYVSIDENHSSPDSNNNDNTPLCEAPCKAKFSPSEETTIKQEDYIKMGPAEKELWRSCAELTCTAPNMTEELKSPRWERRPIFTPIIEESDRSLSGNLRESGRSTKQSEIDPVTVAFAELNDIFQEYNSTSEQSSLTTSGDYILDHSNELEYTIETNEMRVESASERVSDVTRPTTIQEEGEISEVQLNATESISVSQTLPFKSDVNGSTDFNHQDQTKFGEMKPTNIVIEKKKYWDERIREIEETRSEQAKKKRLISKNLRHNDSLSKRRGKQIVKNFLVASEADTTSPPKSPEKSAKYGPELNTKAAEHSDVKLVGKWKKYWDEKLENEKDDVQISCFGVTSIRSKYEQSVSPQSNSNSNDDITLSSSKQFQNLETISQNDDVVTLPEEITAKQVTSGIKKYHDIELKEKPTFSLIKPSTLIEKDVYARVKEKTSDILPVKQELPEEVFKAFETSPKRFFGTSRKQILNKIDAFLGKPSTADEIMNSSKDVSGAKHEKGLVSSRISMFHNISHVEDLPWKCGKSTSMLNIRECKDFEIDNDVLKSPSIFPETVKECDQDNTVRNKIKVYSTEIESSNTQWNSDKSTSMLNIRQRKDSEKDNDKYKSSNITPETPKESEQNTVQKIVKAYSTEKDHLTLKNQAKSNTSNMQDRESIKDNVMLHFNTDNQENTMQNNIKEYSEETENVSIKTKRLRLSNLANNQNSVDKSVFEKTTVWNPTLGPAMNVQKTVKDINRQINKVPTVNHLRKSTVSKSEMDIFSKITSADDNDDLDKHKSYEVLPKANVKNFINMYETVTKTAKLEPKPLMRKLSRTSSVGSEKLAQIISSITGIVASNDNLEDTENIMNPQEHPVVQTDLKLDIPKPPPRKRRDTNKSSQESLDINTSMDCLNDFKMKKYKEFQNNNTRKERYVSLSDIEVEIIENDSGINILESPDSDRKKEGKEEKNEKQRVKTDPVDYKSRFKLAKQYFQSLEELSAEDKSTLKLNECEQLLLKETLEKNTRQQKRLTKNIKSRSMDSSELANIWRQMQQVNDNYDSKLIKISEKFNVDDLFTDVTEGKLSRQGSLRGIPHKKAVLEAFRSMDNVSDTKLSSYEIAVSQLTDFAKENKIKNAQTYLTEYPYLPTTDPSKYHSRLDAKASGLVSMKELMNNKPRRNSVPDIRINSTFIVDL